MSMQRARQIQAPWPLHPPPTHLRLLGLHEYAAQQQAPRLRHHHHQRHGTQVCEEVGRVAVEAAKPVGDHHKQDLGGRRLGGRGRNMFSEGSMPMPWGGGWSAARLTYIETNTCDCAASHFPPQSTHNPHRHIYTKWQSSSAPCCNNAKGALCPCAHRVEQLYWDVGDGAGQVVGRKLVQPSRALLTSEWWWGEKGGGHGWHVWHVCTWRVWVGRRAG